MSHRYYLPNQEITVQGKKEKYLISIATNGTAYHKQHDGDRRLASLWQGKIGILNVTLPDDTTIQLKPTENGIQIVEKEKTENV